MSNHTFNFLPLEYFVQTTKISQNGLIDLFSRSLYTIITITPSSHEQTASSTSNLFNLKTRFQAPIQQASKLKAPHAARTKLSSPKTISSPRTLPLKFTPGYMSSIHVAWDQSLIALTANSWTLPNTTHSDISAYVLASSSECTSASLCFLTSPSCVDLMLLGYYSLKGSIL